MLGKLSLIKPPTTNPKVGAVIMTNTYIPIALKLETPQTYIKYYVDQNKNTWATNIVKTWPKEQHIYTGFLIKFLKLSIYI